jgi:hypothetical protein
MATYISLSSGDWSSASTWLTAFSGLGSPSFPLSAAGQAPQSNGGDKIIIRGGHTVTYNVSGVFGDETSQYVAGTVLTNVSSNAIILSGGTLKASRTISTELTARGTIYIAPSGTLDWGTTSDPISNVNANITLHYMTQLSALSASTAAAGIYLHGSSTDNQYYYNNIYMNGRPRLVNTTLAVSAASGATTISVVSSTGWRVNDKLIIATEYIGNIASATAGVLSSTIIQSMTGNNITISPPLNSQRSKGTSVGNFTSNVNIKSYDIRYPSFGIFLNIGAYTYNPIDINYIKINSVGSGITTPTGWVGYAVNGVRPAAAQTGNTLGALTVYTTFALVPPFTLKGIVIESYSSVQAYPMYVNGKLSETITIDDYACYNPSAGTNYACYFNSQASVLMKNSTIYRASIPFFMGASVPNKITLDNCALDGGSNALGSTINGLTLNITNSKLRSLGYITPLDAIQSATIRNSTIIHTNSAGLIIQPNVNASGTIIFSNCTFLSGNSTASPANLLSAVTKTNIGRGNKTAQTAEINIFQPNGNLFDFRKFNYYHYSVSDLIVRKRGITSYRIKPEINNTQFYNYYTIPAVADTPIRIKGSLRFDSNYGTQYPPSINFNGAGDDKTFTCTPTVDIWQDFDITLNPTTTDDITMTITCQSSATNGFVWLDGIPITPYIQNVRHYGFVFDKAIDRTVNSLNTLTENQVSALSTVSNLDYLYDEATYWSVLNPSLTSYIDLVTVNGSVLDFGNRNITVTSNVGTGFAYNSASNTIIINSDILSAGNNFNTLKTTGNLILSGTSTVSNITLNASLSQLIPVDLTGVVITGLLTYNTNVASQITYTNCTVTSATNVGSANIIIKKINSTITYA